MQRAELKGNEVPLKIVGSTVFGRYPKISTEETYNMLVSDGFLVPYAGYAAQFTLSPNGKGRGAFSSISSDLVVAVVGTGVYIINPDLSYQMIGSILTSSGDVFIAENNSKQIAITDYANLYVYDYGKSPATFSIYNAQNMGLPSTVTMPGYISFQDGRLILASTGTSAWQLSGFNNATVWGNTPQTTGQLQTKTDTVLAAVPVPGHGNLLLVFGYTVGEAWTDQGLALFPYAKNTTFNLDYGCLNPATIDSLENYVVWISQNEKSGPAVTYTTGGEIRRISTDGIDFKLSNLTNPSDCYGFLFRQDGHVIYQFAFPTDNLSYAYDFNTQKFFTVTDEALNYHPARKVVFFNGVYYFVSNKDGNFYEFDTSITDYVYSLPNAATPIVKEIPRIRICPPIRLPSQRNFIAKNLGFTIENGQPNTITNVSVPQPIPQTVLVTESLPYPTIITTESGFAIQLTNFMGTINFPISSSRVDLSISRDGGQTFGNSRMRNMNASGKGKSLFIYRQLGRLNDSSVMLKFIGFTRFVVGDGTFNMYQ